MVKNMGRIQISNEVNIRLVVRIGHSINNKWYTEKQRGLNVWCRLSISVNVDDASVIVSILVVNRTVRGKWQFDWQTVISLLWSSFKARLTYNQQQEVNMVRARYSQLKCKSIQSKVAKVAAPYEAPAKLKVVPAISIGKTKSLPRPPAGAKKVGFGHQWHRSSLQSQDCVTRLRSRMQICPLHQLQDCTNYLPVWQCGVKARPKITAKKFQIGYNQASKRYNELYSKNVGGEQDPSISSKS